jgi:ribose-phosphate pyrophosphokinase
MMLVGDVAGRTAILIDDMADTCKTVCRAANLVKKEGATKVYGLVTHGLLNGDAVDRIRHSALDKLVVTNSVDQMGHKEALGDKLEVLEVGFVFAEVCVVTTSNITS